MRVRIVSRPPTTEELLHALLDQGCAVRTNDRRDWRPFYGLTAEDRYASLVSWYSEQQELNSWIAEMQAVAEKGFEERCKNREPVVSEFAGKMHNGELCIQGGT